MNKICLTGLLPEEISELLPKEKEKYRGVQIFRWIHELGASSFDDMTNLSKTFRAEIDNLFTIGACELVEKRTSSDLSTDKFLWRLFDGLSIESVIIRDDDRITACISSQVGCKMRCSFCRTGEMGFIRNLSAGEILDQLIQMKRILNPVGEDISNIVFMGMGEPLDNLDAVIKAFRIVNMETGMEVGQRKTTISTCGIVPGMSEITNNFARIGLALSLNATDDALRTRLMPINKKYPLAAILEAARAYTNKTRRRITLEYILMEGVNDSLEQAEKLLQIARSMPSKVNLIVYNEYPGSPFRKPSTSRVEAFQRILTDGGVTAFIRKSKGQDIMAACGQLAGEKIKK